VKNQTPRTVDVNNKTALNEARRDIYIAPHQNPLTQNLSLLKNVNGIVSTNQLSFYTNSLSMQCPQ